MIVRIYCSQIKIADKDIPIGKLLNLFAFLDSLLPTLIRPIADSQLLAYQAYLFSSFYSLLYPCHELLFLVKGKLPSSWMSFHIRGNNPHRSTYMIPLFLTPMMPLFILLLCYLILFRLLMKIIAIPIRRVNFLSTPLKDIHLLRQEITYIGIQFIDHHFQPIDPPLAAGTARDSSWSYAWGSDHISFFTICWKIWKSQSYYMFPYPLLSAWVMKRLTSAYVTFFKIFMYYIASVMRVKTSYESRQPLLSTSQATKIRLTAYRRSSSIFSSIFIRILLLNQVPCVYYV